jgi:glycosyltransferase involved in cell wall biosynthesis
MRVLLCKGRFAGPISGSDETLVVYATQLKTAGHDVAVAVLYPFAGDDPYYARLREAGVPVSCIAQKSLVGRTMQFLKKRVPHLPPGPRKMLQQAAHSMSMQYVRRCRSYFARFAPEVIHVMTPDPAVMAMIRGAHAAEIPVLYHELGTPDFLPELEVYYQQLGDVLPLCDAIAALSPSLARRFSETFAGSSSPSVLPLMVDDVRLPEDGRAPSPGATFGFAARMEYGKGPLSLLEAFARLRQRAGGVSLRMAGDGPQHSEAAAYAQALGLNGRCSFVGTYIGPAAKSAFMRSIDVFMLPSLAEGTPNCVIEAMAHGLPVIATAIGGIPDTVSPEMSILVPPGDVAALADAMAELASNPARRAAMGRAARQRYDALFSPAAVLPLLADCYRRVAGASSDSLPAHPWA